MSPSEEIARAPLVAGDEVGPAHPEHVAELEGVGPEA